MRRRIQTICLAATITATVVSPLAAKSVRVDTVALSLSEAVARADQIGEEVGRARENRRNTDAQVTIARSAGLPQLRLNSSTNRTLASARGQAVGSFFAQPFTYSVNANLSQTLYQGGRVLYSSRAARATREAADMDIEETRLNTNLRTQQAYLQALFSARLVEIQRQALQLAQSRLEQTEHFERAGRVSRYDLLRARVEVANLEPQVLAAQEDSELAILDLKRLANIPFEQNIILSTVIDSTVLNEIAAIVDTTLLPASRPLLRQAELLAQARTFGVSIAKADRLPTISLSYQHGVGAFPERGQGFPTTRGRVRQIACPTEADPDRTCAEQNGGWFGDRAIAFTISLPIFDGFRTKGAIATARSQERQAEIELADIRERVFTEYLAAKAGLARAQAQYDARRQNVEEAVEAFELANVRYARGLGTQLDVSDAQLALTTAQTNAAKTVYDLYLALVTLARAQGNSLPLPH